MESSLKADVYPPQHKKSPQAARKRHLAARPAITPLLQQSCAREREHTSIYLRSRSLLIGNHTGINDHLKYSACNWVKCQFACVLESSIELIYMPLLFSTRLNVKLDPKWSFHLPPTPRGRRLSDRSTCWASETSDIPLLKEERQKMFVREWVSVWPW